MLASVTPDTALELLEIEHEAIRQLINELSDEEMTRPDTIEYGLYPDQECSFKDLLAHLTTYEAYALEAIDLWNQGEKHWIADALQSPAKSRDVHFGGIADRAHLSLQEMLDEWDYTQSTLMTAIGELSEEQWKQPAPYPTSQPTDLGGMLEAILVAPPRPMYRHLPVHIPDSEDYIRAIRA